MIHEIPKRTTAILVKNKGDDEMNLRHLPTKRKLKKDNADLKLLKKHLERRLQHAEDDLDTKEDELKQYRQENERLWAVIAALTDKYSDKDKHSGFECVGVD